MLGRGMTRFLLIAGLACVCLPLAILFILLSEMFHVEPQ